MNPAQEEAVKTFADKNGLSILMLIPFDPKVTEADMQGETPLKHKDLVAVQAIDNICEVLLKKRI
jgi:CO dehydrogenase nickel-insertion accessory protein CooC1